MATRHERALNSLLNVNIESSAKLFVAEYIIDHDHRRASRRAGISLDWAVQLLDTENIQNAIKIASQSLESSSKLDANDIQDEMWITYNLALQNGSYSVAAKTLDSLAKLQKIDAFAANKLNVNHTGNTIESLKAGRERMNNAARVEAERIIEQVQESI